MTDYLIEAYNAAISAIQDREAKALSGALSIYTEATAKIVEAAALERVEVAAQIAAQMSQRDHEYRNGRPAPAGEKKEAPIEPPKAYDYPAQPEMSGETVLEFPSTVTRGPDRREA